MAPDSHGRRVLAAERLVEKGSSDLYHVHGTFLLNLMQEAAGMEILNKRNLDRIPPGAVYVGRGSPLGNPYRIGADGDRGEVIGLYRRWLTGEIAAGNERVVDALRCLREDTPLVCHCAPAACHAEVIREIWQERFRNERPLVFVFGSNLAGRHGKGAARHALEYCGAMPGVGSGPQGASYAIPTKDRRLRTLPIPEIAPHVHRFLRHARENPGADFRVTRIGCGLAGYRPAHIAPMFASAPGNCLLPEDEDWSEVLKPWQGLGDYPVRLAVGGSRSFRDEEMFRRRLDRLVSNLCKEEIALISGGAAGTDTMAAAWARARGIPLFEFVPLWRDLDLPCVRLRHGSVGKRYNANAGMDRNAWMLANATHAAFFWNGRSPGTRQCISLAGRMEIVMRVLETPDTGRNRRDDPEP